VPEEIWIDISETGDVTVEGKSVSLGKDCKALTQDIEQALGTVTATKLKPEYRQVRSATRKVQA
jgi:hypothetical protein